MTALRKNPPTTSDRPVSNGGWRRRRVVVALIWPWYNALITLLCFYLLSHAGRALWHWGVTDALYSVSAEAGCASGNGACWAAVGDKWRLIVFGLYPAAEQWRPTIWLVGFLGLSVLSVWPRLWSRVWVLVWVAAVVGGATLLSGSLLGFRVGLVPVGPDQWGGLPLTLMIALGGTVIALPLGIALALGRQGAPGWVRTVSTAFIEVMRGVPLITILFFSAVVLPLFLPPDLAFPKVWRAIIATGLCASGYVAEVMRGALQAVSPAQSQSAASLGLTYWQTQRYVVLPQALRVATPGLVNTFLAFFKSTSLVIVIGLFDLLGATRAALSDPIWQAAFVELYLFAGAIYFVLCFSLSMTVRFLSARSRSIR